MYLYRDTVSFSGFGRPVVNKNGPELIACHTASLWRRTSNAGYLDSAAIHRPWERTPKVRQSRIEASGLEYRP